MEGLKAMTPRIANPTLPNPCRYRHLNLETRRLCSIPNPHTPAQNASAEHVAENCERRTCGWYQILALAIRQQNPKSQMLCCTKRPRWLDTVWRHAPTATSTNGCPSTWASIKSAVILAQNLRPFMAAYPKLLKLATLPSLNPDSHRNVLKRSQT